MELASERDAARLLKSVCVQARDLFGATYVTLGVVDRNQRTLQRLVVEGTPAENWIDIGDKIPGILGRVVDERRAVRGDNARGTAAGVELPGSHPDVRAFLAAPVASPAHVYGWLFLARNEGTAFTGDDEHLLLALAGQVGRIYENGYFYAVAQAERDRAQRYLDTAEVILLALDTEAQ